MAARVLFASSLHPVRLSLPLTLGLGATTGLLAHNLLALRRPSSYILRCDTPSAAFASYQRDAKTPVVKQGRMNPQVFRQISTGSITGLIGGLAVSVFSKPLALLIGLLVVGVQVVESKLGMQVVPYQRLQRVFGNVDVKSALRDNIALKVSFGITFALAAFAEF